MMIIEAAKKGKKGGRENDALVIETSPYNDVVVVNVHGG